MNKRLLAVLLVVAVLAGILAMGAFAEEQKDPIRIFTIGNSHGNDSTWQLARVFAAQDPDREVIVGTMYYSGCAMSRHVNYAYNNTAAYTYHKNVNGVWTSTQNCDLATGLADEPWDIVVMQEMNVRSGQEEYFQTDDIAKLMAFVDSHLENEHKFYWNFIWANPVDQTFWDPDFDPQPPTYDDLPGESWIPRYETIYGSDQMYMYEQMVANVNKYILTNEKFHDVLPSGTAIQYANNMLGQTDVDLYRDYTHMSDLGRLIVAYAWYAQITGESIDEVLVDVVPAAERPTHRQTALGDFTVTAEMKQVIKEAVNYAMEYPLEVPNAPGNEARCDQCRYEPEWTAWDGSNLAAEAGHYYLTDDVTLESVQVFPDTEEPYTISINLNGHTLTGKDRLFEVGSGVTVSIMDGAGGGKVVGCGVNDDTADIALVLAGGAFCLHDGELTTAEGSVAVGLLAVEGTLTVRGGTISSGNASTEMDVLLGSAGVLDICDGRIDSVEASGSVKAARKAVIGTLELEENIGDILTVTGNFEGQIGLKLNVSYEAGLDVGNSDSAAFGEGAVYLVDTEEMGVVLQDTDLVLKEATWCSHCEKNAVWIPMNETWQTIKVLNGGHYYLAYSANSYAMTERTVTAGHSVCLDLNGKGYTGTYRGLNVARGATLTILGTGWISGRGTTAGEDGGVIYVAEDATLNLYEGTLRSDLGANDTRYAGRGGVVAVDGVFNMYGGKVRGDSLSTNTPVAWPTLGGTVYVGPTGTLNITGGSVNTGTVAEGGSGASIYSNGVVYLSGDAVIDEIQLVPDTANGGPALGDMLEVGGTFTGTAVLNLAEPAEGLDVGNLAAEGDPGTGITVKGLDMAAKAQGEDLVLKQVIICDHCTTEPQWTAWDGSAMTAGTHYYLGTDVQIDAAQELAEGDYVLDLRGKTLTGTGRAFQVASGVSLSVMDSVGGGKLQAAGVAGETGGVVRVAAGGSFQLYGGDLTMTASNNGASIGGIIHNSGTVSIYGGNIYGGVATTADNVYSGYGATLNIYGGTIEGPDCGSTVYTRGVLNLSGDPVVTPGIRLVPHSSGPKLDVMVNVSGDFSGEVAISADAVAKNVDIGAVASGATIAEGSLTVYGSGSLRVVAAGSELMIAGTAYCQHCQKNVLWTPVKNVTYWQALSSLEGGHYCMAFSSTTYPMAFKTIASGDTVCIDLNGKHIQATNQAYKVQANATLNIMGEGKITGRGNASHANGGTIQVAEGGTLNLYSGTLGTEMGKVASRYPTNGGVVAVEGIFNMYGGSIDAVSTDTPDTWTILGGAVYVAPTGVMNMHSGTVNSGVIDASGSGESIYVSGKLNLSGDASADEVMLVAVSGSPAAEDMFTVNGTYTGDVAVAVPSPAAGTVVGTAVDCILADESLIVNGVDGMAVYNMNGLLVIWDGSKPFVVSGPSGFAGGFDDPDAAIAACGEDQAIILMTAVEAPLALTKDLTVDLNGYNLVTETTGDYTLYIKDSFTDDYDITADSYGRTYGVLTATGSANVAAAPGYVKITADEEVSFHKVDLTIKSMGLRPENAGLYFKSDFAGDQLVAEHVTGFGVALSVAGEPDETTLQNPKHFTRYEAEAFGTGADNTSTLLTGILKSDNGYNTNQRNAATQVYGRAYIEVDGVVTFGETKARSLREQLEGIDSKWDQLSNTQRRGVVDLYGQFGRIMDQWTMPNFLADQAEEAKVLRVLSIGNSYSRDSTNMLHKVFQSQNPDKKVQIAVLYNGGCSLSEHVGYIEGNEAEYEYSYTDDNGKWVMVEAVTMDVGLKDQQWDIVVMQEASAKSGEPENYQADNIEKIQAYVLENVAIAPEFYWNMTWAWPQDPALRAEDYEPQAPASWETTLATITNYDQMYQYGKITSCVQNYILTRDSFVKVFPTGTAIQYANNMLGLDDLDLYRDYTHLNDYGRLIAAHVWYARLMDLDELTEVNVDVIPASERLSRFQQYGDLVITEEMKQQILDAVNWALENPYTVPGTPS